MSDEILRSYNLAYAIDECGRNHARFRRSELCANFLVGRTLIRMPWSIQTKRSMAAQLLDTSAIMECYPKDRKNE